MNRQTAKSVSWRSTGAAAVLARAPRLRRSRINRGQSMEFAMISIVALLLMVVGIQYALLGAAAVAVSQGSSSLARYCALNPGAFGTYNGKASTLPAGATELLSPTICPANTSCPSLTVNITSYSGTTTTTTNAPVFGDRCIVSLSYNATSKLALPNPFLQIPGIFPGVTFPTTFTGAESQLYEKSSS